MFPKIVLNRTIALVVLALFACTASGRGADKVLNALHLRSPGPGHIHKSSRVSAGQPAGVGSGE